MKEGTKTLLKGFGIGLGIITIGGIIYYIFNRSKKEGKLSNENNNLSSRTSCSHLCKCDCAGSTRAENSLKNISLLIENGVGIIEMDIQITRDGIPVLFHDDKLDKKTNGTGTIQSKNWSELKNIRYDADTSQGISKLEDALDILRDSKNKNIIYQLDKCSANEIEAISKTGMLKGLENQMLCKSTGFIPDKKYIDAGVKYMPILPANYVGKMNDISVIDDIVEKCKGFDLMELSFGTQDSLVLDGTLAKKLREVGCGILGVAVTGVQTTNPNYYDKSWGDNLNSWKRYFENIGCQVVMTDKPVAMIKYLESLSV